MASIDDSLYSFLSNQSAITAIVGTGTSCRISPVWMAQKQALPRIVYWGNTSQPTYYSRGQAGISLSQYSVQCQAGTIAEARDLEEAVKTALSAYQGAFGNHRCQACFVTDDYDTQFPAVHADETGVKAKTVEIELHYV